MLNALSRLRGPNFGHSSEKTVQSKSPELLRKAIGTVGQMVSAEGIEPSSYRKSRRKLQTNLERTLTLWARSPLASMARQEFCVLKHTICVPEASPVGIEGVVIAGQKIDLGGDAGFRERRPAGPRA